MSELAKPNLSAIIELITSCLDSLGKPHDKAPAEWTGARFRVESTRDTENSEGGRVGRSDDLPSVVHGYRLDGKPVLIGDISSATSRRDLLDNVRRYRNQAMIARSWIGAQATSISLFLIGPLSSELDQTWHDWALEIELDEKVCRKIVWLLSASPNVAEAALFLEGTSLAQPWKHSEDIGAERLDSLAQLGLPDAWLSVISDDSLSADDVVGKLIEVGEGGKSDAE